MGPELVPQNEAIGAGARLLGKSGRANSSGAISRGAYWVCHIATLESIKTEEGNEEEICAWSSHSSR